MFFFVFVFSSCCTSDWRIAVLQVFFVFDNISVKLGSLQTKLLSKLISNMIIILASKRMWKILFNTENFFGGCGGLFLAVPAGNVSRCFVTVTNLQQELTRFVAMDKCLTSLKSNYIHFEGRHLLQTIEKTLDPTTCHVCVDNQLT